MSAARILLVDDNPDYLDNLAEILAAKREMHPDVAVLTGLQLGAEQLGRRGQEAQVDPARRAGRATLGDGAQDLEVLLRLAVGGELVGGARIPSCQAIEPPCLARCDGDQPGEDRVAPGMGGDQLRPGIAAGVVEVGVAIARVGDEDGGVVHLVTAERRGEAREQRRSLGVTQAVARATGSRGTRQAVAGPASA